MRVWRVYGILVASGLVLFSLARLTPIRSQESGCGTLCAEALAEAGTGACAAGDIACVEVDASLFLTCLAQCAAAQPAGELGPAIPVVGDEYEPDDSLEVNADIAADGTPQTHSLSPAGDVDHVAFLAEPGKAYTVQTSNLKGGCDTVLELLDPGGAILAEDHDSGGGRASRLTWTAPDAPGGTLVFVRIRGEGSGAGGEGMEYDLSVSPEEAGGAQPEIEVQPERAEP